MWVTLEEEAGEHREMSLGPGGGKGKRRAKDNWTCLNSEGHYNSWLHVTITKYLT